MRPFIARLSVLLAFLLPVVAAAQGQSLTWTISTVPTPGDTTARVVMDEVSELTVDVLNTSNNKTRRMSEVSFVFPSGYIVLDSPAPTGWIVTFLDVGLRWITFSSTAGCGGTTPNGLGTGEQARFKLRVIAPRASVDVANQQFVTGNLGTTAKDRCLGDSFDVTLGPSSAWVRSGLSAQVSVRPRALGLNGQTQARIVFENRTTTAQNGISAMGPSTSTGTVSFTVAGTDPDPFLVNVPQTGAGVLVARAQVTSEGTTVMQVRGANGANTVTSQVADTQMVNVRGLAVSVDVDNTDAFTGETVQVRMTVTNTFATDSLIDVRPRPLVTQGSATFAALSGPTPASVSRLSPGTSAHFVWRYQVTGAAGADFRFRARVDATRNGIALAGDLVDSAAGRIASHRVRISPAALATNVTNQTVTYTVQNRGTRPILQVQLLRPASNYFTYASTPATAGWTSNRAASGIITWTAATQGDTIPVGQERTFSVVYLDLGSATALTEPTAFRHRMQLVDSLNGPPLRIEAPVTLMVGPVPEVERLTGVARDASVTLTWDNPALHGGVLVLRAEGAAPSTAPVQGKSYAVGEMVGNARVVYTDAFSSATSFTDTTVTNGTTYFYRVHNADDLRWYSPGNRPTSAALIATPRAQLSGAPLWCYSVGLDARQQPITELGVGIFSSFNNSVVALLSQVSNPTQGGTERWRPLPLSGLIGSRFPVVPLRGLPGQYILVGDQAGVAYAINATTGQVLWQWDNGGQPIGTIQSFPVTQLHDFANAAYQAAHPGRDLVFFATRLANAAQNRVVALNAATGAVVWTYQPGDLGMVSGGMVVDYTTNQLFIGTKSHAGSLDTLRVLNTLATGSTAQEVARLPVGDIDVSLVRNALTNNIFATDSDGTVHAVSVSTLQKVWSLPIATRPAQNTPAFTSFVRPQGGGFVASIAAGRVEYYETSAANPVPVRKWSTPIASPSGTFSLNRSGVARIYVGSSDGKVHQLELTNGTDSGQVSMGGAQRIGTPTIDHTASRLHVGSEDGRICAFPVPFP